MGVGFGLAGMSVLVQVVGWGGAAPTCQYQSECFLKIPPTLCPLSTGAPAGECEKNQQFMRGDAFTLGNCRASCGDCEVCQDDDIGENRVVWCVWWAVCCVHVRGVMSRAQTSVIGSPGSVSASWPATCIFLMPPGLLGCCYGCSRVLQPARAATA
jgi:hypothetical protein